MKKTKFLPLLSLFLITASCSKISNVNPSTSISSTSSSSSSQNDPEVEEKVTDESSFEYDYNLNFDTVTITALKEGDYDAIVIPDYIDGRKVTSLSDSIFFNETNSRVKRIYIGEFVNAIFGRAFYNFDSIEKIEVSEKNEAYFSKNNLLISNKGMIVLGCKNSQIPTDTSLTIASYSFANKNIESIYIPKNVTSIDYTAFCGNKNLAKFVVEEGSSYSTGENGTYLIENNNTLVSGSINTSTISQQITKIGAYAFYGIGIKKLNIPKTITSLTAGSKDYSYTFWYSSLEELTFDEDIKITSFARGCKHMPYLKEFKYPKSLIFQGGEADVNMVDNGVTYCEVLETIYFVTDVYYLFYQLFDGNTALKNVVLNNSTKYKFSNNCLIENNIGIIKYIGKDETFTIPDGITQIARYAFANNKYIKNVILPSSVFFIGDYAFNDSSLETIQLDYVTTIGTGAFANCSNLKTIHFPNISMRGYMFLNSRIEKLFIKTGFADSAFYGTEVGSIEYEGKDGTYKTTDDKKSLCIESALKLAFTNENGGITIPSTAKSISSDACRGREITNLVIPNNITSIGAAAFKDTKKLQAVYMSDSVATAGMELFEGSSLNSIRLSNKLDRLYSSAFAKCENLKEIVLPDSLTIIDNNTFESSGLIKIQLSQKLKKIYSAVFRNCRFLESISLPNTVTALGTETFNGCYNLKYVKLSNNLTEINTRTFNKCISLKNVDIPLNVTSIKDYAFSGCGLETIQIPSKVTSLSTCCFSSTRNLKEFTFTSSINSISTCIFENSAIEKVEIKGVKTFSFYPDGSYSPNATFYMAYNLKEIKFDGTLDQFKQCFSNNGLCFKSNFDGKLEKVTYFENNEYKTINANDITW